MKKTYVIYISVNDREYYQDFEVKANKIKVGKVDERKEDYVYPLYIDDMCLWFSEPIVQIECDGEVIYS